MQIFYFAAVVSSYFFFFFRFSSPVLSGRRLDVYHTSTHDVTLVRIYNACLKCAAARLDRLKTGRKNYAKIVFCTPSHNFVALYLRN